MTDCVRLLWRKETRLAPFIPDGDQPPQHGNQDEDEEDETIACHTFLVTKWAQPLDAARSEVIDQLGVVGRRTTKMCRPPLPKGGQVVFTHPEVVVMRYRGLLFQ